MHRNHLRFLPIILYVILIFIVSSVPGLTPPGPEFDFKDKIAHFIEYMILGALLFYAIGWSVSTSRIVTFMFLFAVGVSVGALEEIFQSYVPSREMSIYDWFADAAGVALGVGLYTFTSLGNRRRRPGRRSDRMAAAKE